MNPPFECVVASFGGFSIKDMDIYVKKSDAIDFNIKGNELILYSLIKNDMEKYGKCERSLSELSKLIGITKGNVFQVTKRLIDKKLIHKEQYIVQGVKFNRYKAL